MNEQSKIHPARSPLRVRKKLQLTTGIIVGFLGIALAGVAAMFHSGRVSTTITKRSPDRQHTAKLTRMQSIDVNFRLTVDGARVYDSPDFAPVRADFREQLIWGATSKAVVLEVAGLRLFGYHVDEKRPLTDSELQQIQLTPFEELHFEGTLPKE